MTNNLSSLYINIYEENETANIVDNNTIIHPKILSSNINLTGIDNRIETNPTFKVAKIQFAISLIL